MYNARYMNTVGTAVIIPCFNEESTIAEVVKAVREVLPHARILVGDNNSTDSTAVNALGAGAQVVFESVQGKAAMVRTLIRSTDAEYYVMIDGDNTYSTESLNEHLAEVSRLNADMLIGSRISTSSDAYRRGHVLGNKVLSKMFSRLMRTSISDSLSGYRIMSQRFVKTLDISISGFEIEAELNGHAATINSTVIQRPVMYKERHDLSHSKLNTTSDGIRIVKRILQLFQRFRPLAAFALLSIPWFVLGAAFLISFQLGWENGTIKTPSLVVAVASFLIGLNLITAGIIIKRISQFRNEYIRLMYLQMDKSVFPGDISVSTLPRTLK
jgi:glycosyltransferase involved in cell wall biosynthesis